MKGAGMALATIADVEARLGRELTVAEESKATAWLDDASALFINRAEQKFEIGESTVRLFPNDGIVRLLQRPVIEIINVEDINGAPVDFTWDGFQTLFDVFTNMPLVVTYEHGSDEIPADVVAVVAGMVARTLSISPEAATGVTRTTTGPFSQEFATWAVGQQVMMSPAEMAVADSYRQKHLGVASTLGNTRYVRNIGDARHFGL
jgi:hypothetical protein